MFDGAQTYLVFQLTTKDFKAANKKIDILKWKSKGISDENIKSPATINNILNPLLEYGNKLKLKLNGRCLKQDKITYNHEKIVNIYIVYEISKSYNISDYPTMENLFGAVSLTKDADIDKYKYCGDEIVFDRNGFYSHPSGGTSKNAIIFG